MMSEQYKVAIAGATGAVGVEFLRLLEERRFPISRLLLLASARSAGKTMRFDGRDVLVEELTEGSFENVVGWQHGCQLSCNVSNISYQSICDFLGCTAVITLQSPAWRSHNQEPH